MSIDLIDTTVRDGNQSLWGATGLDTGQMLQIAPTMDRVGFNAIDFSTSTHMAVAVRFKKQNPWERTRLMREAMPNTPLSFLTTGMRFISWEIASHEVMEFSFRLLVNNGIRRFAVMDPMNNVPAMLDMAALARKAGGETIVAALTFTLSPLHDDAYFVNAAKKLASSKKFDRLYLKDPGGLVSPERAITLIPALKAAVGAIPLEFHSHCTIALAQFSYLEAAKRGVQTLHVAATAAANGTSQPSNMSTVRNLRDLGLKVNVNDEALQEMDSYFTELVAAEGLPHGQPQEFDASYFRHQMPGGMMGTMKRQLSETRRLHLLPQVLEEVERVRADFGYPIMVTPFSQVVATQAVLNVVDGEPYKTIPDEAIRYILGRFGAPTMPLNGNLEDKVKSSARAKELKEEPMMASLDELRAKIGKNYSDEEFLLRAVMPADLVDAMVANGAAPRTYNSKTAPVKKLISELSAKNNIGFARVSKPNFKLELAR
jgi:oxaloacetate decarboxylase (Na+ extruding) subunit alpha